MDDDDDDDVNDGFANVVRRNKERRVAENNSKKVRNAGINLAGKDSGVKDRLTII